ncbi:T9SS type A sorting domain-containing protein [Flavobacterium sp.]|uniref:T9SS type A sorting domain-containing protein n=1 Tax=Flavobacterium sp. TaxID=239 RepID=UPI00374D8184
MKLRLLFIISILLSVFEIQAQIPTTGLIKDYKFTNGVLTSDVNPLLQVGNQTLIPTGTARNIITDRNGETSKAISLNGDSFTAGGTNAASVNNYSISFWVKTTTNESPKRYVFDQHNTAVNPAGFSVALKDGKIYFNGQCSWSSTSVSGNSGIRQVISPVINDGQWHHVVCLLSSTRTFSYAGSFTSYVATYTYSMYVDNVWVGSDAETDYPSLLTAQSHTFRAITPTKLLTIGKAPDLSYLDYQEGIDQIRYYERTLNVSDIELLFNEDKPKVAIYVNATATGANNGTTWADAFTNLESAITPFTSVNEVWVAAGSYKPIGTLRTSTFLMKNALKMYGGFNGTETLLSQRNPKINITTLSGDVNGNDNATINATEATRQDNLYHVISVRGNIKDITIDGFTISGGNANGGTLTTGAGNLQFYHTRGGAIYINPYTTGDNISVDVANCVFEKNSGSDTGVVAPYYAGGVITQSYTANFDSCIFKNNFSGTNAQILYAGTNTFSWYATGELKNCLFNNNTSTSGASCIYLSASATGGTANGLNIDIINSTFSSNIGMSGNVIRGDNASTVRFKNSIIYNNGSITPFTIVGTVFPTLLNTISQNGQLGGLSSNPLLSATFELGAGSLAIDAGNNAYLPAGTTTDLFGNNRIHNTTVDLGCYEYGSVLGTNEFKEFSNFSVYPNPSNGIINVESDEDIDEVVIYSLQGRAIIKSNVSKIDISDLSNGIYLMQIKTIDGKLGTKKIIKN